MFQKNTQGYNIEFTTQNYYYKDLQNYGELYLKITSYCKALNIKLYLSFENQTIKNQIITGEANFSLRDDNYDKDYHLVQVDDDFNHFDFNRKTASNSNKINVFIIPLLKEQNHIKGRKAALEIF